MITAPPRPTQTPWVQVGTATNAANWTFYIWESKDAEGLMYRITNNANPPWSAWGVRDLEAALKKSNLTRSK